MITILLAAAGHGSDAVSDILLILAFVLVAAKLGGDAAERLRQPGVLGGADGGSGPRNLTLLGEPSLTEVAQGETFTVLAELGAVLLLFQVGLESTPRKMLAGGGRPRSWQSSGSSPRVPAGPV